MLTWAAALAEAGGSMARAEMLYLRAAATESAAFAGASLRLVALYIRQDRGDEARVVLAAYLARKPDDAQARSLQAQLDRGRRRER